jgi:hypothetical protein
MLNLSIFYYVVLGAYALSLFLPIKDTVSTNILLVGIFYLVFRITVEVISKSKTR